MFINLTIYLIIMINILMFEARKDILCYIGDNKKIDSIHSLRKELGITYSHTIKLVHKFEKLGLITLTKSYMKYRYALHPELTKKGIILYNEINKIKKLLNS